MIIRATVYKIVDRPGLEQGASIDLQFDPSRHKVTLNHLRIIRDGVVLDRLDDVKFDIFRQEKDAEKGMYDGWLTAHVNVDDVRVGDVVDYAETYEITPLVGKDLFFYSFSTEWEDPVALIRTSIIWPTTRPLEIKPRGTEIKPAISASGADTVYLWEIANPKPVKVEENLPAEYPGLGIDRRLIDRKLAKRDRRRRALLQAGRRLSRRLRRQARRHSSQTSRCPRIA